MNVVLINQVANRFVLSALLGFPVGRLAGAVIWYLLVVPVLWVRDTVKFRYYKHKVKKLQRGQS